MILPLLFSLVMAADLTVLSVTPRTDSSEPFPLTGSEALTVVFSHAIIRLGSDWGAEIDVNAANSPISLSVQVPGRLRYVTPSIVRFDPDGPWPTDLMFTLSISPDLTTFDGKKLTDAPEFAFVTRALAWTLRGVTSKMASALTNDRWSSVIFNSKAHEVPDDGIVSVDFSRQNGGGCYGRKRQLLPGGGPGGFGDGPGGFDDAPQKGGFFGPVFGSCASAVNVSVSMMAPQLMLRDMSDASMVPVGASAKPCAYGRERCFSFSPPEPLVPGRAYQLVLPEGSTYHPLSGPLRSALVLDLVGPLPFAFAFNRETSVSARRFNLYLRHGLNADVACTNVSCDAILDHITVKDGKGRVYDDLELTRPELAELELVVPSLRPNDPFTVDVSASATVLDGFGLSLQEGSFSAIAGDGAPSFEYVRMGSTQLFDREMSTPYQFVHRKQGARIPNTRAGTCVQTRNSVSGWNVDSGNIVDVLAQFQNRDRVLRNTTGVVHQQLSDSTGDAAVTTLPSEKLFGTSQTFIWQSFGFDYRCNWVKHEEQIVSRADLSLTLINGAQPLALVTRTSTGKAVSGAVITFYGYTGSPVTSFTTGADGTVIAAVSRSSGLSQFVTVTKDGEMLITNHNGATVVYSTPDFARTSGVTTTDRNLYKEGDMVSIKGYVRDFDASGLLVQGRPRSRRAFAYVQWLDNSNADSTAYSITDLGEVNAFGAFSGSIEVPAEVSYGVRSVQIFDAEPRVSVEKCGPSCSYVNVRGSQIADGSINIADPRIPTGVLTMESTSRVYSPLPTGAAVTLDISTMTYTGAPLPKSRVTLAITVSPPPRFNEFWYGLGAFLPPKIDQKVIVVERIVETDASGQLSFDLRLTDEELDGAELEEGQTLAINAQMIGATRELLTADLELPVRASEYQLGVSLSTASPVPGLSFATFVDVRDADDSPVLGAKVTLELVSMTDAEADNVAALVDVATGRVRTLANEESGRSCTAVSDAGRTLQCTDFVLPDVGKFALRASVAGPGNSVAETVIVLGQSASAWKRVPLRSLPTPVMVPDKEEYLKGDTPKLSFMNPFDGESTLLVRWGNALESTFKIFALSAQGETTVTLKALGSECALGCQVTGTLWVGRGSRRLPSSSVPLSTLFDYGAPKQLVLEQIRLEVDTSKERTLGTVTVKSDAEEDTTSPRSRVEFTVDVKDVDGKPMANGEVHLFVTDRKLLDLAPHAVLRAADAFTSTTDAYFNVVTSLSSWITGSIYEAAAARTLSRARALPWWSFGYQMMQFADLTDSEFLRRFSQDITFSSYGGCRTCDSGAEFGGDGKANFGPEADGPQAAAPPRAGVTDDASGEKVAKAGNPTAEGGNTAVAPETRGSPVWTPLSATATVKNGKATFVLESMPDNLGTFRVAALATNGLRYGSGEMEIVSRLRYNVEPSVPRIVRVDDRFVAGVTVSSNLPASAYPVTLFAAVSVPCEFIGLLDARVDQKVVLKAPGPVRVEWGFEATGMTLQGVAGKGAGLVFTMIDDKFAIVDQVRVHIPVLAQQLPVSVADSFAVEATPKVDTDRVTGLAIPEHVDLSATVAVEVGVGRLPSLVFYAHSVLHRAETAFEPSGMDHVSVVAATLLLGESGYGDALDDALTTRMDRGFSMSVRMLHSLTLNDRVGLVNYLPRSSYLPTRADVRLNAFALGVTGRLESMGKEFPQTSWRAALEAELVTQAQEARERTPAGRFADFDALVAVFDALGFGWKPRAFAEDFSVARLLANRGLLSSRGEAQLAAALLERASSVPAGDRAAANKAVDEILLALSNKVRVQGRTAYIARRSGAQEADWQASYYGLRALSLATADKVARVDEPAVLTEKLANWAAAPRTTGVDRYYVPSGMDTVSAMQALVAYDVSRDNDEPDFRVQASVGAFDLLVGRDGDAGIEFRKPGLPSVRNATNAWFLPPVGRASLKNDVRVTAVGSKGEASVVVSVDFVPCERKRDSAGKLTAGPRCTVSAAGVDRGIKVEKAIRAFNPTTGESVPSASLTTAPSGTQVEVTIQLTTADDLENVEVIDLLSGGMEALDFADETMFANNPWGFGWWWASTFPVKQVRKDRVTAFAYRLPAGTSSFTYKALIVTPGVFALPPTKAFAQAQPEVLGLSAGGVFGSSDPAWTKVVASTTEKICLRDVIVLRDAAGQQLATLDAPGGDSLLDMLPLTELPTTTEEESSSESEVVGPTRNPTVSADPASTLALSILAIVATLLLKL